MTPDITLIALVRRVAVACLLLAVALPATARAAQLPTDHNYQRVLRDYLATLSADDFEHGFEDPRQIDVIPPTDPDRLFREWILTRGVQPIIGSKRGYPCVTAPPELFTLEEIESEKSVMVPPIFPTPTAWLVSWDIEGNPYHDMRALKLRVFVHNVINLTMIDHQLETNPESGGNRSDWAGNQLIRFAYRYNDIKDALPEEIQKAYETGLKKHALRHMAWGVKGDETNQDMVTAVGLYYATEALDDPEFTAKAKAFLRELISGKDTFHPAGYFVDRGGPEMAFGGMTAFLANWCALASGWDFAEDVIEKRFRLRAHLSLPEPDGNMFGPSHFNTRLDTEPSDDQWNWAFRHYGAPALADEAVQLVEIPTVEEMTEAVRGLSGKYNGQIGQNPRRRTPEGKLVHIESTNLKSHPWTFRIFPSWNYPVPVCFPYDHYRPGTYAKLVELKEADSPLLANPHARGETFIRNFEDAFVVARMKDFAAIVHTGPVGQDPAHKSVFHFPGPHGFGGGQLSAFWTPESGSILLSRRGGMNWDNNWDPVENWKSWPIHAVIGRKGMTTPETDESDEVDAGEDQAKDGDAGEPVGTPRVFTSARIAQPMVESRISPSSATIRVSGQMPRELLGQGKVIEGAIDYERHFAIDDQGVRVTTRVTGYSQDTLDELYETIPFILRGGRQKADAVNQAIEFKVGDQWQPAKAEFVDNVTAVRVMRWDGALELTFDRPRRVTLSPEEFQAKYTSRTSCRNVLIDLLENGDQPMVLTGERSIGYRIAPTSRPESAADGS